MEGRCYFCALDVIAIQGYVCLCLNHVPTKCNKNGETSQNVFSGVTKKRKEEVMLKKKYLKVNLDIIADVMIIF